MFRPVLPLLAALLALAACATPREACISSANRELRVIDRLVAETRANIGRGYALREVEEVRVVDDRCPVYDLNGQLSGYSSCDRTVTRTRDEPVAIDLNAERAKLDSLLERQAAQRRAVEEAVRSCTLRYPE
ncbi:hypothetical protein [Wenxinia saemankumensis]|uniref:Uncharacterized protein n=1 Tax=Wenxinia saemankumensis TaxID=1447782 RepID=A0A1M6DW91_9RHOB|nr:hypothetical protein [Wenxinia saemankumensis]SHI77445.1 hypothetical protein SAMN05444417_1634 [Wenxinia saemankumensis]